jgi:hypothetical protein
MVDWQAELAQAHAAAKKAEEEKAAIQKTHSAEADHERMLGDSSEQAGLWAGAVGHSVVVVVVVVVAVVVVAIVVPVLLVMANQLWW